MDSQHRHELAQNDLEKYLQKSLKQYNDTMEVHGNRVMLWACVILLSIAGIIYYTRTSKATNAAGWEQLAAARSPEDFASVADAFSGSSVGAWARLQEAESYMQQGVRLSFTDREGAISDLDAAKNAFALILDDAETPAEVRERALYGHARTLETTADGDMHPTIAAYEKLLTEFPQTSYRNIAEQQISYLKTGGAQSFYTWFHAQNPKPEDREQPSDLTGAFSGSANSTGEVAFPATSTLPGLPALPAGSTAEEATSVDNTPVDKAFGEKKEDGPKLTVPALPEFPGTTPKAVEPKAEDTPKPTADTEAVKPE